MVYRYNVILRLMNNANNELTKNKLKYFIFAKYQLLYKLNMCEVQLC